MELTSSSAFRERLPRRLRLRLRRELRVRSLDLPYSPKGRLHYHFLPLNGNRESDVHTYPWLSIDFIVVNVSVFLRMGKQVIYNCVTENVMEYLLDVIQALACQCHLSAMKQRI